jgi:hypothetical protein
MTLESGGWPLSRGPRSTGEKSHPGAGSRDQRRSEISGCQWFMPTDTQRTAHPSDGKADMKVLGPLHRIPVGAVEAA